MHLLIAYFISNTCAKYYKNLTMLSRVTSKNVRVFFRHSVFFRKVIASEASVLTD